MDTAILNEAYERLRATGPEWGADTLTNHGPMAVEVLVRRGHADEVHRWVDAYIARLDELPAAGDRITPHNWREALGDGRRIGDWTRYLERQVAEQPWRDVLAAWWPRLLPGIAAGATHGVIRTSHAVRTLLGGDEERPALTELAHALAFWAARWRPVPGVAEPAGASDAGAALDAVPRLADQQGPIAGRLARLGTLAQWPPALAALRGASEPADVPARLADLVSAATARYLRYGQASPVLLVHTATAPNAVLHTLPALPDQAWLPSLAAVWAASAAITAAYAPAAGAAPAEHRAPPGQDAAADLLERAVAHGDEHVIKFTDTAVDAFGYAHDPDVLAAAARVGELIPSQRPPK